MIKAILYHIYLLLTLRHDGSGMPKSAAGISLIVAAYVSASVIRHAVLGDVPDNRMIAFAVGLSIIPLIMWVLRFELRILLAYLLLSASIDVIGIAAMLSSIQNMEPINRTLSAVEIVCLAFIVINGHRADRFRVR